MPLGDLTRFDPPPEPERAGRRCDPLAAAIGNATLLGLGYLLLRRWRATAAALGTTVVLLLVVSGAGQPGWTWRVILFGWWLATTAHGWRLASGGMAARAAGDPGRPRAVRRQRIVAAATAATVLVALTGIAIDSRRIASAAVDAHRAGDCGRRTPHSNGSVVGIASSTRW